MTCTEILWLVGGFTNIFYFPFHTWDHPSHWRTHIFQRGWNHQPVWRSMSYSHYYLIGSCDQTRYKPVISMRVLAYLGISHVWPTGHRFHSKFTKFSAARPVIFDRKGEIWELRAIGGTSLCQEIHRFFNPSEGSIMKWQPSIHIDSHRFTNINQPESNYSYPVIMLNSHFFHHWDWRPSRPAGEHQSPQPLLHAEGGPAGPAGHRRDGFSKGGMASLITIWLWLT